MPRHADGPKHGTTIHPAPFRTRSGRAYSADVRRRKAEDAKFAELAKRQPGALTDEELRRRAAALAASKDSN
jgi:hypothetical protein